MRHTEAAIEAMTTTRNALDRAYSEELCMRVDAFARTRLVREIEATIASLQQTRRLVGGTIGNRDL